MDIWYFCPTHSSPLLLMGPTAAKASSQCNCLAISMYRVLEVSMAYRAQLKYMQGCMHAMCPVPAAGGIYNGHITLYSSYLAIDGI